MNIKNMILALEDEGISICEMARKTRTHQSALSFIKNGQRKDLYYEAGKRFENFYNGVINKRT